MRMPDIYSPTEIRNWSVDENVGGNMWRPARPVGFELSVFISFRKRLRAAWRVFNGSCDVLHWERPFVKIPSRETPRR